MKILILNWRYIYHPWAGGAERHIHEIAKQWTQDGHRVTILCGGYKKAIHEDSIDGINIIRIGNTYSIYVLAPLYYLWFLRKLEFDLIIDAAHGLPFFTPFYTSRKKVVIIHQSHEELWKTEFGGIIGRVGIFIENYIVPILYRDIQVITLSNSTKQELESLGYHRVYAVPPGISVPNDVHRMKKTKIPTILYLGRIRKYKRVDFLLQILPVVCAKVKDCKLIIAGNGQDMARIDHLIRTKHLHNVELKGWVSEEEKYQVLTSSWVLAFPSITEGWGLVSTEAAACGTPTIGFNVPGLTDAVKSNVSGLLVRTHTEFIQALIAVLTDSDKRRRYEYSSKRWAKRFTWKQSARRVLQVVSTPPKSYP